MEGLGRWAGGSDFTLHIIRNLEANLEDSSGWRHEEARGETGRRCPVRRPCEHQVTRKQRWDLRERQWEGEDRDENPAHDCTDDVGLGGCGLGASQFHAGEITVMQTNLQLTVWTPFYNFQKGRHSGAGDLFLMRQHPTSGERMWLWPTRPPRRPDLQLPLCL